MGSLTTARERMQDAWRRLLDQWRTTESLWSDGVERRFEKEYMDEYEPVVSATLKELDRLDQVITQAERNVK